MAGSFRHFTPPSRIYYGDDSLEQLPQELARLGCRRPVIVCGGTMARHRALGRIRDALGEGCAGVFEGVQAHSPLPAVIAACDALRRFDADAAIPVGGGSAVVTARAASIVLAEGRPIDELCTRFAPGKPPQSPRLLEPKIPQLVVPTTPTTAYAKAGSAVLDPAQGRRLTLFDPKTRPAAVFFDPAMAETAPVRLALDAGLNAFAMAVQGIEASRDPLADALLLHALRLLAEHLPRLLAEPNDADNRGQLMLAALLCGQGTDYAPSGLNSALSHCIGVRFELQNGLANAILLPHTMRFNATVTGERLRLVCEALQRAPAHGGQSPADAAIAAVDALFARLELPRRLRDMGIPEDALEQISKDAEGDWFLHQNPRRVTTREEILGVLRAAW